MPSIEVQDLKKTYGKLAAIDGISFSVEPGEVVGFLGPNGAGKTTTMKILTGFISATSGSAKVDGLDAQGDSLEVRRRIGYLPENAPVYRDMIVRDYLKFVCDVRQVPKARRAAAIDEATSRVGLSDVMERPIDQLSKGYRQRVGLAQALVHDPPILILDEPTTGLDPNQIVEIRDLIAEIGKTKTILLSTHILGEVSAVCGRVLIVNEGKIVGFGTPAELEGRARGGSRIEVVVRGEGDLKAALGGLPGVREVRASAGEGPGTLGATVFTSDEADPRPAIFAAAVEQGWTLLQLSREAGSLEDAFRALTASPK
ncbi:MAG: ATP-binding cassette domain-containing protein [Proteobacteria bacterium]|nr:ATP-binding cassette domain-containing protein [Pseudomonadota bacterium]